MQVRDAVEHLIAGFHPDKAQVLLDARLMNIAKLRFEQLCLLPMERDYEFESGGTRYLWSECRINSRPDLLQIRIAIWAHGWLGTLRPVALTGLVAAGDGTFRRLTYDDWDPLG